ncbi:OmpA family protein [Acinetobacter sp. P8-3-8]|uniref:OmpA family protein n=1 Tax=Acinetobacter sp. P8-3-8 TaxID=1029823 RepID=UPI0002485B20|nr:OmpA family protein [Acinetobacter sp. P8-3-8]
MNENLLISIVSKLCIVLAFISLNGCSNTVSNPSMNSIQIEYPKETTALKKGLEIYFKNKSTEIDEQYRPTLSIASQLLKNNKNFILQIEGHTDSSGSLAANNKVSIIRANRVRDFILNEYHVNPDQLIATGLGPTKPIANNSTADGRAKNRRVTVTLKIQ